LKASEGFGVVSQIQGFCVNDGEGIRTNVFLSGCPLRCQWCANPETWTAEPKLTVVKEKCTGCNNCVEICIRKAALNPMFGDTYVTEDCNYCGLCVDACPNGARSILGSVMSVQEVVDRVMKDSIYFRQSGGGVTFSGGEPTFQKSFLRSLVNEFCELGIDMAIESCGYFNWEDTRDIFEKIDFIFMDMKIFDSGKHVLYTGMENALIHENIKSAGKLGKPIVIRIPLMEGVNADDENILNTAAFVKENVPGGRIEVLPYHNFGTYKYDALGKGEHKNHFEAPSAQRVKEIEDIIWQAGVEVADYK